jgi:hypothetical protein
MLILAGVAGAVYAVALPDFSQSSTLTATVSEQATVSAPATVAWTVNAIGSSSASASKSVSASSVVLADGKKLRIEIKADAASFTAPTGGSVTWAASDVSWNAPSWTNGTGATGSLSSSDYTTVVDMTSANSTSVSTTALVFTLAAKATVDRAGDHTLAGTWKFSSF